MQADGVGLLVSGWFPLRKRWVVLLKYLDKPLKLIKTYWKEAIEFHSSFFKKLTYPVRTKPLQFLTNKFHKDIENINIHIILKMKARFRDHGLK